jgi:phosphatidate cytidylyltransferase
MKTRVITAIVLVPVLVLVLLICPARATAWALALMLAIGAYELLYSTGLVRHTRMVAYSMVAAFAFPLWCYYSIDYGWTVLALLCYAALLFGEVMLSHTEVPFEKVAISLVAGLLIPAALSSIVRIRMIDGTFGKCMVAIPFVLAFLPDSGAYFAGRFFGKHKLAPIISPKKTVEGAIGGLLSGMLFMIVYALIVENAFGLKMNYPVALIYGLIGALGAIFGDLCFSVIKRQTGIKDYGNLFPGHGGILDRFDSVIVVAPLTEALLNLLPVGM